MSIGTSVILWVVALIILVLLELATVQLVSIWFVIGTIPAIAVAAFGGPVWLQLTVFLVVSVLILIFARPYLVKRFGSSPQATNADRVLNTTGLVLEEVNNLAETGRVSANGLTWTARSQHDNVVIPKDTQVTVLEIQGVKLIVSPKS